MGLYKFEFEFLGSNVTYLLVVSSASAGLLSSCPSRLVLVAALLLPFQPQTPPLLLIDI